MGFMMKKLTFALALVALPVHAGDDSNGTGLMERGVELFLEGLRDEMSPALENLRDLAEEFGPSFHSFLTEMGPAFTDMLDEVKDWTRYHPPEMLPNGDIILRKKTDPDPIPDPIPGPDPDALPPMGPTDI